MRHWIAFIVIGLVIGAVFGWYGKLKQPVIPLVAGLLGGVIGGVILYLAMGATSGKYVSLAGSIVLAAVLAWLGRSMSGKVS